jgi:asparagine N-glycosylation enzyme membrane subunit Stt3
VGQDDEAPGIALSFRVGGAALLGFAAWLRLNAYAKVLIDGELMPQGGDSAYHLRRTMAAVETFPSVPVFDAWMNWPDGGLCHWAPGMDFLGALGVRLSGLSPESLGAAILVSLLPVILGLGAVWVVVALARELIPAGANGSLPLGCGAVMAVLPQAVATSRFGRVDHHIFEVLCMALLGLWVLRAVEGRRDWRWELFGGLVLAGGLATFAGSVLYAGIAAGLLLALHLGQRPNLRSSETRGLIGSGAPAFVGGALLTACIYGIPVGGTFSYVFPSLLQPSLLLVAALTLWGGQRRGILGILIGSLAGGAVLLSFEAPRQQFLGALSGWLGREDPWLASIAEFQPLLKDGLFAASSWANVDRYFGLFGILALPFLILGLEAVRRANPRKAIVFGLWTLSLVVLCLLQRRFGRIAAVNLALCSGLAINHLAGRLTPGARRRAAVGALLIGLLVLLSPPLRSQLLPSGPRALAPVEEAALFLKTQADGPSDARGVAAPWDLGHFILWTGQRPVVATGFGTYLDQDGFDEVRQVQLGTEAAAIAWMDARQLGHLVAGAATFVGRVDVGEEGAPLVPGPSGRGMLNPRFVASHPMAVSLVGGSGLPLAGVAHFEELRPVFASSASVERTALPMPNLWVYRRVKPQQLAGVGQPGDRVFARIDLNVRGTKWPWAAVARVRTDGTWSLSVPLELGSSSGGIHTPGEFLVSIGGQAPIAMTFAENAFPHP